MNLAQATSKSLGSVNCQGFLSTIADKELKMTKRKNTTSGFFEKYKHPKWQKRRLEIMEQAAFTCGMCHSNEKTLNVHHLYYVNGRDPWEYADDELMCLCTECHEWLHQKEDLFKQSTQNLKRNVLRYGESSSFEFVVGFMEGASQCGPYRIKFEGDKNWLLGFMFGAFKVHIGKNAYHSLVELIEFDDGFIDYDWLRFFTADNISESLYNYTLQAGYYCPESFPSWYRKKIQAMIDDCSMQLESAKKQG